MEKQETKTTKTKKREKNEPLTAKQGTQRPKKKEKDIRNKK
jgi:hypothetical protein